MSYITLGKHSETNSLGWWGTATRRMTMGRAELHGNSQKKIFSLHVLSPIIPSNAQFKEFVLSAAIRSVVTTWMMMVVQFLSLPLHYFGEKIQDPHLFLTDF